MGNNKQAGLQRIIFEEISKELENNKNLTAEQRFGLIKLMAGISSEKTRLKIELMREERKSKARKPLKAKGVDLPTEPAAQAYLDSLASRTGSEERHGEEDDRDRS